MPHKGPDVILIIALVLSSQIMFFLYDISSSMLRSGGDDAWLALGTFAAQSIDKSACGYIDTMPFESCQAIWHVFSDVIGPPDAQLSYFKWFGGQPDGKEHF